MILILFLGGIFLSQRNHAPSLFGHNVRQPFLRTSCILLLFILTSTPLMVLADNEAAQHVVLVDSMNDLQRAGIKASGVTLLEDYGDLALVKGTDAQIAKLTLRRNLDDRTVIGMADYIFDTRYPIGSQGIPKEYIQDAPTKGQGHYLVQFKGPVKQAWTDELGSMGAENLGYIPNFAVIIRMDASLVGEVRALPFVIYIGTYQPAFKVAPDVRASAGLLTVNVVLYQGEDPAPVVWDMVSIGADVTYVSEQFNPTIEATVLDTDVLKVARLGPVMSIDMRYAGGVPPIDPAQWISQSNKQGYYPLYDHGLHGENMTIGNADTGIWVNHLAFHDANHNVQYSDPATNTPPDLNHRKIVNYWTFAPDQGVDSYGHGSMTVGVNVGNNDPENGNPQYHGMAYLAKVSFQDVWNDAVGDWRPADKSKMYDRAYVDGARIHSGSLVCNAGGAYNDDSQELDQFLWNHKDFLGVIANHNYGSGDVSNSVCDMASAKDTMSMGAAQNTPNQNDLHDYTGRGPTDDGRLKPTVSATTDINAPQSGTQNGMSNLGGTSGATPDAAGNMVLARQYFYDGFYPSGTRTPADGFNATGALLKAIAVNSADEMNGGIAYRLPYNGMNYPSNTQGWGRLDLDNALYFVGDNRGLRIDDNKTGLTTGFSANYNVGIVGNDQPLKVTLVWTDYWGQIAAGKEIVNDLDLQVTAPGGATIYKGNVIGASSYPHQSVTGGNFDNLNVEEQVINNTPTLGTWAIKVTAVNTPQGPQPFGLVITGNMSKVDDLAAFPQDITFSKSDPVEGDNVTVNVSVRNLGGNPLPAVGIELDLDGKMLVTKTIPVVGGMGTIGVKWPCTWGDHTFTVIADPLNLISEARKDNNVAQRKIYVNKIPVVQFTATPQVIHTFENVTINASKSTDDGSVAKYKYDWGEGAQLAWSNSPTAVHMYKKVGTFNLTVKVMDNSTLESPWAPKVKITVNNRDPWVNATASAYTIYTLIDVSFDASRSGDREGVITYAWDFEDGNLSTSQKPIHFFAKTGYYNVTLTVKDINGATNSTKLLVHVLNRVPTASFKASGKEGNVTTQFNFAPTVQDMDGTIVKFQWDFGDGTSSALEAPVHRYKDDGLYNVTLVVFDDDGASSQKVYWNIIIDNLPPVADLTADAVEALTYDLIHFTSGSTDIDGTIANLTWNLGDGTILYGLKVTHEFKENKVYRVTLKVTDDDDALREANMTIRINDRPPVVRVEYNKSVIASKVVFLSAQNSTDMDGNIVSYLWDFGNGAIMRGPIVNYTFWAAGTYRVNLTVTDNDHSKDTITLTITVSPAPPPPKKPKPGGQNLSTILLLSILIIVLVIMAIVAALILMRRRKKPYGVEPVDFDPNSVAAAPPPGPEG